MITVAVEGDVDEAIAKALLRSLGFEVAAVFGRKGKDKLMERLPGYANAAKATGARWLVIRDADYECPVTLAERAQEAADAPELLCFRVAVQAAEAWLLADRVSIASFLGVSRDLVPRSPDDVENPKRVLVNLARRSRKREIREGLVPSTRSLREVGPAYVGSVSEYARTHWKPEVARGNSPSLERAILRLQSWI